MVGTTLDLNKRLLPSGDEGLGAFTAATPGIFPVLNSWPGDCATLQEALIGIGVASWLLYNRRENYRLC